MLKIGTPFADRALVGVQRAHAWAGRRGLALLVRLAYVAIPVAAAYLASAVLVKLPIMTGAGSLARVVTVLTTSTVTYVLTHRALARLLPLAALLELSIEFPGPAPSRYAVARDAGDPSKLQEIVARAQRGDRMVNLFDAEAARDILALVSALGSHDPKTRGHSERVRVFTDLIAEQLRLSEEDRSPLRWAALLHDVGKLRVPADVLNKATPLDESDWSVIRAHPEDGVAITRPLQSWLGPWTDTIAQHHEKYDGTGYPLGLRGDQICLGARVVAVADAFDVMTAARSYRKPLGRASALRELNDCAGTHFDPRVVRAFLAVSAPRLRLAMGPLSWLSASPFLVSGGNAASAAAQATAGVLAAGAVAVAGPGAALPASAEPPAAQADPVVTSSADPAGHHHVSARTPSPSQPGAASSPSPTAPSPGPSPSSLPPSASPTPSPPGPSPSASGPVASPSPSPTKAQGKPSKSPKPPKPSKSPKPSTSPKGKGSGKP